MNTYTLTECADRIETLMAMGLEKAKIRATLTLEDYPAKLVTEAFKSLKVSTKAPTFASSYYEFLSTTKRSEAECIGYIQGLGVYDETSSNVKKHQSHYLSIASLAEAIWDAKGSEPEAGAESENDIHIKSAWASLKGAKAKFDNGAKVRRTTFHPDKVSHLNDAELTKAYSDFFKEVTDRG